MNRGSEGISGHSGAFSATDMLGSLKALECSGTLVLENDRGLRFILLRQGEPYANHKLGHGAEDEDTNLHFLFQAHAEGDLPQLLSRYPGSRVTALRALPELGNRQTLEARLYNFRDLLEHLQAQNFSGALSFEDDGHYGLILLQHGHMGVALYEEQRVREGSDALRAIYRQCLGKVRLELKALQPHLVASLMGVALGLQLEPEDAVDFSGLELSEQGCTFYQRGEAYLCVTLEPFGRHGRYALCQKPPELVLPDEPPGWESRRYALTLRGKDALNPMTDLAMQFRAEHGLLGKRVLEMVTGRRTVEEAAENLELELSELRPWLDKLEREGMIQP